MSVISEFVLKHPIEMKSLYSVIIVVIVIGFTRWINHLIHARITDAQTFNRTKKESTMEHPYSQ